MFRNGENDEILSKRQEKREGKMMPKLREKCYVLLKEVSAVTELRGKHFLQRGKMCTTEVYIRRKINWILFRLSTSRRLV